MGMARNAVKRNVPVPVEWTVVLLGMLLNRDSEVGWGEVGFGTI